MLGRALQDVRQCAPLPRWLNPRDRVLALIPFYAGLHIAAELMGHRRLETVRAYSLPTGEDRQRAINSLPRTADQGI